MLVSRKQASPMQTQQQLYNLRSVTRHKKMMVGIPVVFYTVYSTQQYSSFITYHPPQIINVFLRLK